MKIIMIMVKTVFALGLSMYFSGCAGKRGSYYNNPHTYTTHTAPTVTKPEKEVAPQHFFVKVGIKDWKVVYNKILYDAHLKLGRVQVEGRYFYLDDVVLKLISKNFPMYYWIVKLPRFENGDFELKAVRREDPSYMTNVDESAPLQVDLVIVIKNKVIVDHYLENVRPWWGTFSFHKIDKSTHRLLFTNNKYPGYLWACKYPTAANGNYKLDIRLIEEQKL